MNSRYVCKLRWPPQLIGVQEGMLTALLQIIPSDGVELATRLACSVYLKNRVHTSYILPSSPRPDHVPIAQSDRTALKANILTLLSASPRCAVTVQLAATLKDLVAHDFPDHWSSLLDDVKRLLGSGNVREVGVGVVAAFECIRAFRFRQKPDVLPGIIATLFPTLEIPAMLHLILKTYKTAIIVNLSSIATSTAPPHSDTVPMTRQDLDHTKNLVLDLLCWGVSPECLAEAGVSAGVSYRVFTDINLRLPTNLALPPTRPLTPSGIR
ncbi:hypothetical protein EDD22DRAFT_995734 [Suillus occidentalis]|nr:hypothetical protein EDD22DRAFT_995734 [Suillus occidentalis]